MALRSIGGLLKSGPDSCLWPALGCYDTWPRRCPPRTLFRPGRELLPYVNRRATVPVRQAGPARPAGRHAAAALADACRAVDRRRGRAVGAAPGDLLPRHAADAVGRLRDQ